MDKFLLKKWNESSKGMPYQKDPSNYAIEKEKQFRRESTILDLGGGQGDDSLYFAQHGHKVIIVDISDNALDKAKNKFKEHNAEDKLLGAKQADLNEGKIPVDDNSVDVVYARLSLHYFPRDITVSLFKEILRTLKQDGKTFITLKSPNDEEEMKFLKQTAREIEPGVFEEDDSQLKTRYNDGQLLSMLSEAGISKYVYTIGKYKEKLGGRKDRVKSGKTEFDLTEITITKTEPLLKEGYVGANSSIPD